MLLVSEVMINTSFHSFIFLIPRNLFTRSFLFSLSHSCLLLSFILSHSYSSPFRCFMLSFLFTIMFSFSHSYSQYFFHFLHSYSESSFHSLTIIFSLCLILIHHHLFSHSYSQSFFSFSLILIHHHLFTFSHSSESIFLYLLDLVSSMLMPTAVHAVLPNKLSLSCFLSGFPSLHLISEAPE
jgi:hypothetical protein